MQVVLRETGRQKAHFMGESSGALRAGLYATVEPDRVDRLVLAAFTYKGTDSPTLKKRAEQVEYFRTHNMRKRDRAMIESIFTRDKPGTTEPGGRQNPRRCRIAIRRSGTERHLPRHDRQSPGCRSKKVQAPVLLIRGEHDGIATVEDLFDFYQQLPHGDKQLVILPNTAHSVAVAVNRHLFWHAVRSFLDMPAPAAI
jgi:pimeloyl-ACP methyl ester carboxylesterase